MSSDLVLEVAEEASLLFLLVSSGLINNPFFIFKQYSILLKSLMDMGSGSSSMGISSSMSMGMRISMSVSMSISVSMSASSAVKVSLSLLLNDSFFNYLSHNGCFNMLIYYGLFVDLMYLSSFLFSVSLMDVGFMHNWDMFLFDKGGVLLMDDWLMVLMNVFLNYDWLMMLMNYLLMMLMDDIFLVFHYDILVMLMDHILMNFFHDGCSDVSSHINSKLMLLNSLSFISLLDDSLLLVGHYHWLFIDLLYDNSTTGSMSTSGCMSMSINMSSSGCADSRCDACVCTGTFSGNDVLFIVSMGGHW